MAINSKNKGKNGELECVHMLTRDLEAMGIKPDNIRRSQQFNGMHGDADVVGLWGVHIEVKRVEKLNIYEAIKQAIRDKKDYELASVFHRRNREKWLVTMPYEDWLRLYVESLTGGWNT